MDRAAAMRQRQQQHQQEMQQAEIMRPVVEAKAKADIAKAHADLAGYEQAERTRESANTMLPQARADFDAIMQLADPEAREQASLEWAARYSHLSNVKEFAQEFDAKKEIAAKLITEASGIRQIRNKIDAEKELISARGDVQKDLASIRTSAKPKTEFLGLMDGLADAKEAGDAEAEAFYRGRLSKLTYIPEKSKKEIEQLVILKRQAEAAGDEEAAAIYDARIEKLNTIVIDPTKQAIADKINGGASKPAPAPSAAPAATKPPKQMSDAELENFMFR